MDKINACIEQLNGVKGTWPAVCRDTGLDYSWLTKFAQGRIKKPGYQMIERLDKYFIAKAASNSIPESSSSEVPA